MATLRRLPIMFMAFSTLYKHLFTKPFVLWQLCPFLVLFWQPCESLSLRAAIWGNISPNSRKLGVSILPGEEKNDALCTVWGPGKIGAYLLFGDFSKKSIYCLGNFRNKFGDFKLRGPGTPASNKEAEKSSIFLPISL